MSLQTPKAWALNTFDVVENEVEASQIKTLQSKYQELLDIGLVCGRSSIFNLLSSTQSALTALNSDPRPDNLDKAVKALAECEKKVNAERTFATKRRQQILGSLETMSHEQVSRGIKDRALDTTTKQIFALVADELVKWEDLDRGEELLDTAVSMLASLKNINTLGTDQKTVATRALSELQAIVDGVTITEAMVNDASKGLTETRKKVERLSNELKALETEGTATQTGEGTQQETTASSPQETAEEKIARQKRIEELKAELTLVSEDAAVAKLKAEQVRGEKTSQETRQQAALAARKTLDEGMSVGRLNPANSRAFDTKTAGKLIGAFGRNPKLAMAALQAATDAEAPEAVADSLELLIDMVEQQTEQKANGEPAVDNPQKYAEDLVAMGGGMGATLSKTYFGDLGAYLKSGRAALKNPLNEAEVARNATPDQRMQARSMAMARNLLAADGSLDLDSGSAKNAIDDSLFHPDCVKDQFFAFSASTCGAVKTLKMERTQANQALAGATKPTGGGESLTRAATGKPDAEQLDAQDVRQSVIAAMLKPINQGNVGSCFATGPVRRLRETDPVRTMQTMVEIASTGQLTPPNGPPVQAVLNTQQGEDPITRSLEYTVANAASESQNSREKDRLSKHLGGIATDLAGESRFGNFFSRGETKASRLQAAIAGASKFIYDPTADTQKAADGSSSKGRFVLHIDGTPIRDRDAFAAALQKIAIDELKITDTTELIRISKLCTDKSFLEGLGSDTYKPWELDSGGKGQRVVETLYADKADGVQQTDLVSPTLADLSRRATPVLPTFITSTASSIADLVDQPEGKRMTNLLQGLMESFGNSGQSMVPMETPGMHDFNAMPSHSSLAPLKGNKNAVQTELLDKGEALSQTTLSPEEAAHLFDQQTKYILTSEAYPNLTEPLQELILEKRPTKPMQPADLSRTVKETLQAYHEAASDRQSKEWAKNQETETGKKPTDGETDKKRKSLLEESLQAIDSSMKAAMLKQLNGPQFVFADTNWGDPASHTYFVIAPDPTTGQPMLFQRSDPSGTLSVPDRKWAQAGWNCYQ